MDMRSARRTAQKAARDLISSRATLVGDLGATDAERGRMAEEVVTAIARGRQMVADAQAQADELVAAAQDLVLNGEERYADAYRAALAGGWSAADLKALGFKPTDRRQRRASSQRPGRDTAGTPH